MKICVYVTSSTDNDDGESSAIRNRSKFARFLLWMYPWDPCKSFSSLLLDGCFTCCYRFSFSVNFSRFQFCQRSCSLAGKPCRLIKKPLGSSLPTGHRNHFRQYSGLGV